MHVIYIVYVVWVPGMDIFDCMLGRYLLDGRKDIILPIGGPWYTFSASWRPTLCLSVQPSASHEGRQQWCAIEVRNSLVRLDACSHACTSSGTLLLSSTHTSPLPVSFLLHPIGCPCCLPTPSRKWGFCLSHFQIHFKYEKRCLIWATHTIKMLNKNENILFKEKNKWVPECLTSSQGF